ncbi:hypothetical protein ACIQVE_13805 [Pseudomonas sp. NPDC098747]|uniref:hypothetical protein n=1 Tax=Pseudomonas sp. NPDC098747 TaxID=3364487 RepID=UPI00383A8B26
MYFTAFTNEKWRAETTDIKKASVLAYDMFQPLEQNNKKYEYFESISGIDKTWSEIFSPVVPQAWIERIPKSIFQLVAECTRSRTDAGQGGTGTATACALEFLFP